MSAPPIPDPNPVLNLMNAFRGSAILFTSVSLGVFDLLADGPARVENLASRLSANPDALGRLLDACVNLGLLQRVGSDYANTPAAEVYLTRKSPRRLTGYITYSDRILWKLWADLGSAVREGTHRWKQSFGLDGPIFASLFKTPEDTREFTWGMHGYGQICSPVVADTFDLAGFKHLVDLGGATGHLAIAACQRFPHLRATILDLSAVVPLAKEVLATVPDVASRIDTHIADFFVDPLPPADLYAVGRILHDWSEDKIDRLLRRVQESLPPGGALLIVEKVLDEDRSGPTWALMQSLNMLLCTEGKERTFSEYQSLLRAAGFSQVEIRRTGAPLDAILARK
ncbi:MAG: class I SAM-dependent methyltransferase [Gemmataceae bacterium]